MNTQDEQGIGKPQGRRSRRSGISVIGAALAALAVVAAALVGPAGAASAATSGYGAATGQQGWTRTSTGHYLDYTGPYTLTGTWPAAGGSFTGTIRLSRVQGPNWVWSNAATVSGVNGSKRLTGSCRFRNLSVSVADCRTKVNSGIAVRYVLRLTVQAVTWEGKGNQYYRQQVAGAYSVS